MRCLVMDYETIPCLEMGRRVWGIDPEDPDAFGHMLDRRIEETEGTTDFFKPFMHRIVAMGLAGLDLDKGTVEVESVASENERELIETAHSWLKGKPTLITWNGIAFDLPVLRYRAMHHAMPLPFLHIGTRNYERYDYRFGDWHYDLMDILSSFGRSTPLSLREAAALCDLPCKDHGSGAEVLSFWKAGKLDQIRDYVREDAVVTARLFLRWQMQRYGDFGGSLMALDAQLAEPASTGAAA